MSKTYHATAEGVRPICDIDPDELSDDDQLVLVDEMNSPDGRWINCLNCGRALGVTKHVEPRDDIIIPDPEELA